MSTFLSDTFTGSSGNLSGHSPDTGGTWVQHGSYTGCALNLDGSGHVEVGTNSTDALYYNTASPASADYDVTVTLTNIAGTTQFPAAAGRINTGADTYYRAQAQTDAGTLYLYKTVAGTTTQLGSTVTGLSYTAGDTITLSMVGTTIVAKYNGTAKITVTDSAISAAGKAGLKAYGTTSGTQFDSVTGVDTSSSSATAFTLSGPSAGPESAPSSNFVYQPTGGNYTGTITPSMTGLAGTWSPTSMTWSGTADAKVATFTASALGTGTANGTGSPSLTQPSSVSYTAKATDSRVYTVDGGTTGVTTGFTFFNLDGTKWAERSTADTESPSGSGSFHTNSAQLVPTDYAGIISWDQGSVYATEPMDNRPASSGGGLLLNPGFDGGFA
jgi:hypothetical protein